MAKKHIEGEQYRIYAIPYNFIDESKMFGGMFKTRNFVEGVILSAFVIVPIIFIPMHSLVLKASLLMFFGMPPIVFGVVGLNNDALSTFIMYYMKYRKKKRKVYFNSRVKTHSVVDIEEGLQAELPRDKVMKLFGPIINKKGEEDQEDELNEDFVFDDDIDNTIRKRKEKNRKDDYSTDIIYEGYELEEILPEQELDLFDSQLMESGEYEQEFFTEPKPEEEETPDPRIIDCEEFEIIEELELIEPEIEDEEPEEEILEDIIEPEIIEELEIIEEMEAVSDAITEELIEPAEAEIEPVSEEIGVNEEAPETTEETSGDEHLAPEEQETEPAPIDILSIGIAKAEAIEDEITKELTQHEQEEPAKTESVPENPAEETSAPGEAKDADEAAKEEAQPEESAQEPKETEAGAEDTEEDDDDNEEEGDTPESIQAEGPAKAKRKRKRRRKKKPAVEGGEHIE